MVPGQGPSIRPTLPVWVGRCHFHQAFLVLAFPLAPCRPGPLTSSRMATCLPHASHVILAPDACQTCLHPDYQAVCLTLTLYQTASQDQSPEPRPGRWVSCLAGQQTGKRKGLQRHRPHPLLQAEEARPGPGSGQGRAGQAGGPHLKEAGAEAPETGALGPAPSTVPGGGRREEARTDSRAVVPATHVW